MSFACTPITPYLSYTIPWPFFRFDVPASGRAPFGPDDVVPKDLPVDAEIKIVGRMPGAGAISSCCAAGNADDSASRALGEGAAGDGPDGDEAAAALRYSTPEVLKQEQAPTSARITVDKGRALDVVEQCRQLDEDLATTFRRGDIRLLRRVWFLEAPDQHLPHRQELEARERQGESPLLDPEEAAALLERGDRSIGAVTQCASSGPSPAPLPLPSPTTEPHARRSPWFSPGDPDPAGVKLKILREALLVHTHIEALFVDFASLFQASRPAHSRRPAFCGELTGPLCCAAPAERAAQSR